MKALPAPEPWSGDLPPARPPQDLALVQLPTGTYDTRAAFAVRGGSLRDERHFAATAVLVRHPEGDLLIDAGFGVDVAAHMRAQPLVARTRYTLGRTARQQLLEAEYDFDRLRGVLITHAHWDHVSGLDELVVPIWMNQAELLSARAAKDGEVFRAVSEGHEIRQYDLTGPPYLGFGRSFDVYGDGSVVIAHAGGHTPGSVVVFVTLPSGERWGFIGDITWQLDGITRRVERPTLLSRMADDDPAEVRRGLLHAIALANRVHIVPSHDVAAYEPLPHMDGASRS